MDRPVPVATVWYSPPDARAPHSQMLLATGHPHPQISGQGLQELVLEALQSSGHRVVEDGIAHLHDETTKDCWVRRILHDDGGALCCTLSHGCLDLTLLA